MAKKPGPMGSWNLIKSVSVTAIAREANRPVSIAIIGPAERRAEAIQALFTSPGPDSGTTEEMSLALPETPFIQGYDSLSEEAKFPRQVGVYDFVIDVGGSREGAPEDVIVYSIAELGGWEATLDRILEDKPTLMLALGRNFPVFRRRVAQRVINETAGANAQFSLVTGIAEAFPLLHEIGLPAVVLSDVIVLTKNQTLMTLRLAATYGLPLDYKSRLKELGPILVNALGWRSVARELAGLIPVIGFLLKPTIAYAGTVTIGKTAQLYYETGEQVTSAQARRIYKEAYEVGKGRVRELAASLRGRKGSGDRGGKKRLPVAPANFDLEAQLAPQKELALAPNEE